MYGVIERCRGVSKEVLAFFALSMVYFVVSIPLCIDTRAKIDNVQVLISLFNVLGTIQLILTISSIRRMQGQWFSLYMVFYCFLYVFSYGQFLMWTFGFHYISEMTVSHHVRYIDSETVVRIQAISLHLLSVFHLGALISNENYKKRMIKDEENKAALLKWIKILGIPMLIISALINFYYSFVGFRQAAFIGYAALFDISMPPLVKYLSYMFVPALFLNLVTHNYKTSWFYVLSIMFMVYALPLMITGDRGSWVYFLGPWLWCYIKCVNRGGINPKAERRKTILAICLVLLVFFVSASYVSIRGEGYSNANDNMFSLEDLYTPYIKPFFEMGQSARILGIILQDNLNETYAFGNTYIADILGMVLPRIKVLFGFPDFYVENWMSSEYLGMVNYGVGFSSFAEAYLNGGLWFSWLYILIFGYFIGRLTTIKKQDVSTHPLKAYFALSATTVLGPSVRATMDLWLREFFWGVLLVYLIALLLSLNEQI